MNVIIKNSEYFLRLCRICIACFFGRRKGSQVYRLATILYGGKPFSRSFLKICTAISRSIVFVCPFVPILLTSIGDSKVGFPIVQGVSVYMVNGQMFRRFKDFPMNPLKTLSFKLTKASPNIKLLRTFVIKSAPIKFSQMLRVFSVYQGVLSLGKRHVCDGWANGNKDIAITRIHTKSIQGLSNY